MDKGLVLGESMNDKILASFVPNLGKFSWLSGTEGRVYFVDDDYVVKQYFARDEDAEMFFRFCEEIKNFGDMGYAVPKVYSWTAIPSRNKKLFNFYVLQERIKGSMLFESDLSKIYSRCQSFCDKADFSKAIKYKAKNADLFGMIVGEYIKAYLETNQALLSLSDSELERFVMTDYNMGVESLYSSPDVQSANIMFDGKKLTAIDNAFLGFKKENYDNPESVRAMVIRDMFLMFIDNERVKKHSRICCANYDVLDRLKKQNEDVCFEAMKRYVKTATGLLGSNKLGEFDFGVCEKISTDVFGKKRSEEICKEIEMQ